MLWHDAATLAWEGTALHDAITSQGKEFILRLWTVGKSLDLDALLAGTPADLRLSVKVTRGDYLLPEPINPVLTNSTLLKSRRFEVLVDAFREYDGWGAGACYMQQWEDRLREGFRNGLVDMNVWGAWSPGCTWPNTNGDTELLNATSPSQVVPWRGRWNQFRVLGNTVPA